jgi:hypothetical protein
MEETHKGEEGVRKREKYREKEKDRYREKEKYRYIFKE